MARYDIELFADYFQFYLQDEHVNGNLSDAWTNEATDRMLAIAPGVVGVGTARNMDVAVTVEIFDDEPARDFGAYDHVVECAIVITSKSIVVAGCTDYFPDALRILVKPDTYRVRVSYANLDSLSADGLDGDDTYRVQLWPAAYVEPIVVKDKSMASGSI